MERPHAGLAMIPLIRKLEEDKEARDIAEFHDFRIALCTQYSTSTLSYHQQSRRR